MRSVAAALFVSAVWSAPLTAQFVAPAPTPVPAGPTTPPLRLTPHVPIDQGLNVPAADGGPVYETLPAVQAPVPEIRVPASYGALYATGNPTTNYIEPAYLRGNRSFTNGDCCGAGMMCEPYGRIWGEFDYLLWKARGDGIPALVSTSPTGAPAALAGVLGAPGARTLAGGAPLGDDYRSGARVNVGAWLNPGQTFGVQVGGFWLDDTSTTQSFTSLGDPILARPFFNALTGLPSSQLIAFPGVVGGVVAVNQQSSIHGYDAAIRGNMCCGGCWRLDALVGYRYLRLEDAVGVNESLVALAAAPGTLGIPVGTNVLVADRFQTSNTFNGVQLGIASEQRFWDRFFLGATAKASLGWIEQVANIAGATTVLVPGAFPVQNTGGLLALGTNIGHYPHTSAVIIPEVNVNLGIQLSQNLRLRAGYNFLYISSVTRPGTIIDATVNPSFIPPAGGTPIPVRPVNLNDHTDFILHGLNAGVELRF